MRKEEQLEYDACTREIAELIRRWEKMRPEEELVIMVLSKHDQKAREAQIEQITRMLRREIWDLEAK